MDGIIALLGLASIAGLIVFSILTLVAVIKGNGKAKTYGKLIGISFLVFVVAIILSPDTSDQSTTSTVDSDKTEEVQEKDEDEEKEEKQKEVAKKDTEETSDQASEKKEAKDKTQQEDAKADEVATEKDKKTDEKKSEEKPKQKDTNSDRIPAKLDRVVDGDTAYLIIDGVSENTRFLLIDTPETKSPRSCVQPYGKEASQRLEELLKSGEITIEYDGPKRDKYDRLLVHVFVDGVSVQETLLEEGLARIAYIYDPPYKYMDQYEAAEQRAKSNGINIWSKSGYVTSDGFTDCVDDSSSSSSNQNTSSNSSSSKSNSSNHGSSSNSNSNPPSDAGSGEIENFKNCTELKKVYPDGVPKGHPAYQDKMDRDKDDWACE